MTAMSASVVSVPAFSTTVPVGSAAAGVDHTGLVAAVLRGAAVIDLRSPAERSTAGVLPGALAIDPLRLAARLDPARPDRLRSAAPDAEWVLVSADGAEAAAAAAGLRARGMTGVRWLRGGYAALTAIGAALIVSSADHLQREAEVIAAH